MWARHKISTTEANEAVDDVDAVWFDPDPHSRSGTSIRVIGYSHSLQDIRTVILVPREDGGYYGANGWQANRSHRRRYERGH